MLYQLLISHGLISLGDSFVAFHADYVREGLLLNHNIRNCFSENTRVNKDTISERECFFFFWDLTSSCYIH